MRALAARSRPAFDRRAAQWRAMVERAVRWHNRPRTLVSEVLVTQLVYAAVVGLIAIGCVWWVANRVVRDNLDDWSMRWAGELETLGSSLYLGHGELPLLELESYVSRFPEILYVRYYDAAGNVLYAETAAGAIPFDPLAPAQLADLESRVEASERHQLDESQAPRVRISQAVTTEAITTDLIGAESLEDVQTVRTVEGFIELGLDYNRYDRALIGNVFTGSIFVVAAIGVLMVVGWARLRRAVRPLAVLEKPLNSMARGDLDIVVPTSPHREIAAIGQALQAAASSIRDRDEHLRKLALFDQLTGISNRYHFEDLFARQFRDSGGAVLFIDLDQFKYVNDTYGHQAGDEVLVQCSKRIRRTVRPADLIGRFGGDEFVMYVAGVDADRAAQIADQLLTDLRELPLTFTGKPFNLGCSIGVAMVEADTPYTPTELISRADLACRHAKAKGRNRVHLYHVDQDEIESIRSHIAWRQRIQESLKENRFELHYQPIMRINDESVDHYEALIRLRDGEGVHYPNAFLPAATRFGLLKDIDRWVIEHTLAELADHIESKPNLQFCINVSGTTFGDSQFVDFVKQQLNRFNLPGSCVIFEITEQVAIGSLTDTVSQIKELVELGCEFAVDDFGTGYSSLSYLKALPVQYIKIDGTFIARLAESRIDQTIVQAIADIARIMGKKTVAEFVGDQRTLQIISSIGIDYAQGFHVGKPAPNLLDLPMSPVLNLRDYQQLRAG